jgi:hypothetical protein
MVETRSLARLGLSIPGDPWVEPGDREIDPGFPYGTKDFEFACLPILSRLPAMYEAYREGGNLSEVEGEVSRWVTGFFDEYSCFLKSELDYFYDRYLNPKTCKSESLDWLAEILGFIPGAFSSRWSDKQKRQILDASHTLLFPRIGSADTLNFLLRVLDVPTYRGCHDTGDRFYRHQYFKVGENRIGDRLGRNPFVVYLRIPLESISPVRPKRTSIEWENAETIATHYSLAQIDTIVSYDYFYVGISAVGEPIFDRDYDLLCETKQDYDRLNFADDADGACYLKYTYDRIGLDDFEIWIVPHFKVGKTRLPAPMHDPRVSYYIFPPDNEQVNSDRWIYARLLAGKVLDRPAIVCHRFFRVGASQLGRQPLFSRDI